MMNHQEIYKKLYDDCKAKLIRCKIPPDTASRKANIWAVKLTHKVFCDQFKEQK